MKDIIDSSQKWYEEREQTKYQLEKLKKQGEQEKIEFEEDFKNFEKQINSHQKFNETLEHKEAEKIPKDIKDEIQKNINNAKKIKDL
jgi:hypothetical protein